MGTFPGKLDQDDSPSGEMADFRVKVAVFNVLRGKDQDVEVYGKGDQVRLTRSYANDFCVSGLLELVEPKNDDGDELVDTDGDGTPDTPRKLTGAAAKAAKLKAEKEAAAKSDSPDA